jgi:alkylation response protein AidB-like acyl-CoA dehydrogenase
MAQPKNYGFEEEAGLLKDSARRFFSERMPVEKLHALVAADPDPEGGTAPNWEPALWREMVDLGWTSLAVPEEAGGLAMPWVAVAGLLEELGRAAVPAPLVATLQTTAILARSGPGASAALAEIAEGTAAAPAYLDADGVSMAAVNATDGTLTGTVYFVQDAAKCERFLVYAREEGGAALYWVRRENVGLAADAIVDLTHDQAVLTLENASGERVCGDADAVWAASEPALWTLAAADMVGAAEWQLQTTVEYAQQRKQFDRPLGFFQAVKHQLVDVMIAIDESKSLLYNAACALDHEPERARELAHMAKASASETAGFASGRCVQCHGGIGFTWECYVQLYFKRQEHNRRLWGDAAWHRARLADLYLGAAA